MGAAISRSLSKVFGSKEMRLLMLGLDAAGKTSTSPFASRKFNRGFRIRASCCSLRLDHPQEVQLS